MEMRERESRANEERGRDVIQKYLAEGKSLKNALLSKARQNKSGNAAASSLTSSAKKN